MKKLLSLLGSLGLVATASMGVVACGDNSLPGDGGNSAAADAVLSGDVRDASNPASDTSHVGQPAYVAISKVVDSLPDSEVQKIADWLDFDGSVSGEPNEKGKDARTILNETVVKDFAYAAAMNMTINNKTIHENQANILKLQPNASELASNAVVPDGTTYQIGFFNEWKNGDVNYKWYWVNLKFSSNPIEKINGEFKENEVTATVNLSLPGDTTISEDGTITAANIKVSDDYSTPSKDDLLESIKLADTADKDKFKDKTADDKITVKAIIKFKVADVENDPSTTHKYNLFDSTAGKEKSLSSIVFKISK